MMTKHRYPELDLEQENGGMPERKDKSERGEKKTQWERVQMRAHLVNTTDHCVQGSQRRLEEDIALR